MPVSDTFKTALESEVRRLVEGRAVEAPTESGRLVARAVQEIRTSLTLLHNAVDALELAEARAESPATERAIRAPRTQLSRVVDSAVKIRNALDTL